MKYVLILNGKVHEIIEEYNSVFPGVPIQERYSADFLLNCVAVNDDQLPHIGDIYLDGVFQSIE